MAQNFKQETPEARHYGLVAILLAISLAFMFFYVREGSEGPVHSFQNGTAALFSPLEYASGALSAVEYNSFTAANNATGNANTISALKDQNEQLRQTVAQLEEYRQESERLTSLLEFKDLYQLEGVTATVVSRTGEAWNNTVSIGKGSADGIVAGMPVAGSTGLVGQVISASPHSADVRLLQDPQSGVAVMIQSNREEGILRGSLDGLLYLDNLKDEAEVQPGDVIITSGLGGSFYRGIIVGTVVKVDGATGSTNRTVVVEPNESTGPLQEVMVITAMNSEGAAKQDDNQDSSDSASSDYTAEG